MSINKEFQLLSDLARLLDRYGVNVFESLARQLAEPELSRCLIEVLSCSPGVIDKARDRSSKVPRTSFHGKMRETLRTLGESEPERAKVLGQFYESLIVKEILPSLRDLKRFSYEAGLPSIKAKSRDKAIIPFMRSLMMLPLNQIESAWNQVELIDEASDRSLEGWSKIILEDRKPER